jgi:hypothetical protein
MRAGTFARQACGPTPLNLAATNRLCMAPARYLPRSEPAKSLELRPRAMPRSAAMFDEDTSPSSRKRVKTGQRVSMSSMAFARSLSCESFGCYARRWASKSLTRGWPSAWRTERQSSALLPLMPRSISDRASMRRTTFSASGEIDTGAFPYALRRVLASISASAQNGRSRIRRM